MRPYTGPADLRLMQELVQRTWSHRSQWHIGDLAWQRFQHLGREPEWPTALWERDGRVVAWGWLHAPGSLALLVDPEAPELVAEVLAWADPTEVEVLDGAEHVVAGLVARGFHRVDAPSSRYLTRSLVELPAAVAPPGFTLAPVGDVAARVACHRSVWHPSRVTEDSYRQVMAAWPYRAELDWTAVAADGTVAAQCLIWPDEVNRVGELEPVGTVARYRRLGLGRAVCLAALHALRDTGAVEAVVYPITDEAKAFYRSLGFRGYAETRTHRKTSGGQGTPEPE